MSRLPPRLQPLWPLAKRVHRLSSRVVGSAGRRTVGPRRGLPWTATESSRATAAEEPETATLHPVRAAYDVHRPMPAGEPADHWVFAQCRDYRVPEQHVLELRGGKVLGRHTAVVSAGGRLDFETSHYFDIAGWKEHPVFLNPMPKRPDHIGGTVVVLSARATSHNYYHFVVDSLTRLELLEHAFPGLRPDAWVVDQDAGYQREYLELLGLGEARIVQPRPGLALTADRLLVPSLPNASTRLSPDSVSWLRERLAPVRARGLPERLYVSRGATPNTRCVTREREIVERLRARGFTVIDPGVLPVREQIAHFSAAQVVVAPHGAALTNLCFAPAGLRLLELFAPGYVQEGMWSIATNIPDSHYRYLVAATPEPPAPGRRGRNFMGDIEVTPDQVDAALDALLAQPSPG